MKYSIILPYYNRPSIQFTLTSFHHHYADRNDYEVIILEDSKTDPIYKKLLQDFIDLWKDKINISYHFYNNPAWIQTKVMNGGALLAKGKFIILTSSECMHYTNILKGLDEEFDQDENKYVICSCMNINPIENFEPSMENVVSTGWLQHSEFGNRQFHFCSSISRDNFHGMGGFDEQYAKGVWYDDDDFIKKIKQVKFPIVPRDDLIAAHIAHDRVYQIQDGGNLIFRNLAYYKMKWGCEP